MSDHAALFEMLNRGMTSTSAGRGNEYVTSTFFTKAAKTFSDMSSGTKYREENEYLKAFVLSLVPETFTDPSPPTIPEFLQKHLESLATVKAKNIPANFTEVARILSEDELVLNQFWDMMYGAVYSTMRERITEISANQKLKDSNMKIIANMHRNK